MKKNYFFLLLLVLTTCLYGQNGVDVDAKKGNTVQKTKEIKDFKIYPNPVVNGKLYIHTFKNAEKKVQLYNILGKELLNITLRGKELNISKFDPGVYILKVYEKGNTSIRKLVVK
ncbi:T9SS type A sorting domain-containing protein [Aureibaculum sp. 2210JD6-5]|uniref:T9SS type A sorting domain-containing protein n=1 Tax=Aureibaculum sp. 2210JD6-5 TaxID=3103957 RepID=UPI002AAEB6C1|nr:T9SS type A sorting domain-containing protein [Aureibaculum sp. 2210JD6-5]MDY7396180.1 T9SS type A sorting domain-containing protein [Aureibaculum sp. 2210JD6-5]